jgi:hypothetical protein
VTVVVPALTAEEGLQLMTEKSPSRRTRCLLAHYRKYASLCPGLSFTTNAAPMPIVDKETDEEGNMRLDGYVPIPSIKSQSPRS